MSEISVESMIEKYKEVLINSQDKDINRQTLGFISNDCFNIIFPIMIECVENIDIFTNSQKSNIYNNINRMIYGR